MKVFKTDVRVFYNQDCGKYGVQKIVKGIKLHCRDGVTRQLYKWEQIEIPNHKEVYTPYKAVAQRWADSIKDDGIVEVRADMEYEYH